ncbi:Arf GTPase arf1 [Pestalotiopsis sp. IQ-011]
MGVLSLNPPRSRDGRSTKLPVYENNMAKERDSNDSYDDSDYDDYSLESSPSSRHTSAAAPMLKTPFSLSRRPGRPIGSRLPNKVIRYLCIGLISSIFLFMFTLVRASQNENHMIELGGVYKPPPKPALWESYDFLTRYYGGIRNLVPLQKNVPEYPRPEDELPLDKLAYVNFTEDPSLHRRAFPESKEFVNHPKSIFKTSPEKINECFLDADNKFRVPPIRYYEGRPNGFPQAPVGSYDMLGFNEDICYERYGRYGPYGLGYSQRTGGLGIGEHGEREGSEQTFSKVKAVDWRGLDWADAQRRCYQSNAARYKPLPERVPTPHGFFIDDKTVNASIIARDMLSEAAAAEDRTKTSTDSTEVATKLPRTAVVIRVWDEYLFREEDLMNLRSLITELSLASGSRYDVHLLVQVRNDAAHPIWADAATYEQRIRDVIPQELQGLVTFWTETQMLSLYQGIYDLYTRGPDLPVHGVYRGLAMAMQYFAYQHPEYDYFWQWEMDIRYTGHYYDFFTKVENWAKQQPRKGLWERNGRFYLPHVHGDWNEFKQRVKFQSEEGTVSADNLWEGVKGKDKQAASSTNHGDKIVWGPQRPVEENDWFEFENDPKPETSYQKDQYVWGVGEEADYIAFNPMFDPEGTTWGLADDITGYNTTREKPPRRAQIITASRMSRRLLLTMHRMTAFKKQFAFPEMWPATVALQHGYKAVFAPHPLYVDREWPTAVLAQTLNNGKNGATGGSRTSVYGDREHNLRGLTWFYDSGFAPNLYRRWLGLKVNNDGGEEFELVEDKTKNASTVNQMRGGEGRMCLPPMLLHPIKGVELPVEEIRDETAVPESDPAA